jgi:hypothetical protein
VAPWPETTAEQYSEALKRWDISIVFGIPAPNGGVHVPNEEIADFVRQDPSRRIGFMGLDPLQDNAVSEIERCHRELGLRGIKLYPVLAGFDPTDRRVGPFYALAERLGLPLLWHMGANPVASGRLRYSTPILLDDVAVEFPKLKMIIAHMGHPWQRDTALVVRKNPNVFTDVSGLWFRPYQGYDALMIAREWGIEGKLLFGSDYPLWTPEGAVEGLRSLHERAGVHGPNQFGEEFIDRLLTRDTLGLLGLDR